jgi:hypothetical protein
MGATQRWRANRTSSRWNREGGMPLKEMSRRLHAKGLLHCPTSPTRRDIVTISFVRSARAAIVASHAARTSCGDCAIASDSVTASSIAMHAPWPKLGVVGCAASPSSMTRPRRQLASGARSAMSPTSTSRVRSISAGSGLAQSLNACKASARWSPCCIGPFLVAHQYTRFRGKLKMPHRCPRPHHSPRYPSSSSSGRSSHTPRQQKYPALRSGTSGATNWREIERRPSAAMTRSAETTSPVVNRRCA